MLICYQMCDLCRRKIGRVHYTDLMEISSIVCSECASEYNSMSKEQRQREREKAQKIAEIKCAGWEALIDRTEET